MTTISPSRYLAFHIAAALCLFATQPRTIAEAEALVITGNNSSPLTTVTATAAISCNNANQRHPRLQRRSFLVTLVTACGGCSSSSFLNWKYTSVAAAEVPQTNVGSNSNSSGSTTTSPTFCATTPTEKVLSQKLSDTRAQIDMAVQASSVQAFSAATEIANDALLDSSALKTLILELSCKNKSNSQQDLFGDSGDNDSSGVSISEILQSVENMRSTLNSPNTLTTEDVKDVMRYGTTARSGIDSIFAM
jgi:hypothetical protein